MLDATAAARPPSSYVTRRIRHAAPRPPPFTLPPPIQLPADTTDGHTCRFADATFFAAACAAVAVCRPPAFDMSPSMLRRRVISPPSLIRDDIGAARNAFSFRCRADAMMRYFQKCRAAGAAKPVAAPFCFCCVSDSRRQPTHYCWRHAYIRDYYTSMTHRRYRCARWRDSARR